MLVKLRLRGILLRQAYVLDNRNARRSRLRHTFARARHSSLFTPPPLRNVMSMPYNIHVTLP